MNLNAIKSDPLSRKLFYIGFFLLSAVILFLFFIFSPQYTNFLRFKVAGVNLKALSISMLFFIASANFISYICLILIIEIKKQFNHFLRPFFFWLLSILLGWIASIIAVFFYTGLNYQKNCIFNDWSKHFLATEQCYNIGNAIYHQWTIVPGMTILTVEILFMAIYFMKTKK